MTIPYQENKLLNKKLLIVRKMGKTKINKTLTEKKNFATGKENVVIDL
jgi:hypothetical protein